MRDKKTPVIGIYEKALPPGLGWPQMLGIAGKAGYDYVEMSVDESDARLARLRWIPAERAGFRNVVSDSGLRVPSICLSGHRKYPFGSADPAIREKARDIMESAIDFAVDCGVRTLQLAGYDVYYEPSTPGSLARFEEGLAWSVALAEKAQVCLGMEIMDTPLMGSITKWLYYANKIPSAWFQVYPDLGNLSAWGNNVPVELALAQGRIAAVHLKDTLAVKPGFPGQFRDLPFGQGCVDFPAAFRALDAIGYNGAYLIEMWTDKAPDPVAEIVAAKAWMLERMREGGIA
ncbi:MAG: L-ribulose-5-phosphate 3-epimerase [Rectinemataceae bacterium]|nr:L-ribulose-5-phosphate 3-epimerase [Rectinemataceae bacterium]